MCDIPQGSIHNLPRGWAMMILRGGHSFSLLWFRRGCGKFPTKITSSIGGGGQPFFSWKRKGNENMLLDALIIPVFYFISTKCWYRTRVWNVMHDAHFCHPLIKASINFWCQILPKIEAASKKGWSECIILLSRQAVNVKLIQ